MSWTKRYIDELLDMGYNILDETVKIPKSVLKKAQENIKKQRKKQKNDRSIKQRP